MLKTDDLNKTLNTSMLKDKNFADVMRKHPHLLTYVKKFIAEGFPVPKYFEKLEQELKNQEELNLIYQISEQVFVHINQDSQSVDGFVEYVTIEPAEPEPILLDMADQLFAVDAAAIEPPREVTERFNVLDQYFDKKIIVSKIPISYKKIDLAHLKKIQVYEKDVANLKYHFLRKRAGLDLLEPYLADPYLEDVSIIGSGNMYVVHKLFGSLKSPIWLSNDAIDELIIGISEQFGKTISHTKPIVDAQLPEGSRVNIVFGKDISRKGTNATIRRFANIPLSITQVIQSKTMNSLVAAYLWMMLSEGMSVFVNGETASGKTTTLMAMTAFIPHNLKILTIEDTPEITLSHSNWISEITRDTGNPNTSITMFDLLKAGLRQRPNYIMVGEIRGAEGNTAFQAMQTGHPVISTFHASGMISMLQRLTNSPINIPKTHAENLNIALFQGAVHNASGKNVRRVLSVNEILGYDSTEDKIMYIPIFNWDPSLDIINFRGKGSSALFTKKLLEKRGMTRKDESLLYDELVLRAKILDRMIEKKIFNFYDVYNSIVHCNQIGLDAFLKEIDAM